jgi:hypothetical protein
MYYRLLEGKKKKRMLKVPSSDTISVPSFVKIDENSPDAEDCGNNMVTLYTSFVLKSRECKLIYWYHEDQRVVSEWFFPL